MDKFIKSDLYRYTGNTSASSFLKAYFRIPAFRYQVAFRMVNSRGLKKVCGGVLWKLRNKQTIQLPRKTKVGYGLYIGHSGPIVISPTAVIGNNVTIGAGSVVIKDIPENATAVGNYAKIINYDVPGIFIRNRWNDL